MSHKCAEAGCGFHLPDTYPFPWCPWHVPIEKYKVAAVAACCALLGAGYIASKAVEARKQLKHARVVRQGQEQWRNQRRSASDSDSSEEAASSDSLSEAG